MGILWVSHGKVPCRLQSRLHRFAELPSLTSEVLCTCVPLAQQPRQNVCAFSSVVVCPWTFCRNTISTPHLRALCRHHPLPPRELAHSLWLLRDNPQSHVIPSPSVSLAHSNCVDGPAAAALPALQPRPYSGPGSCSSCPAPPPMLAQSALLWVMQDPIPVSSLAGTHPQAELIPLPSVPQCLRLALLQGTPRLGISTYQV